MGTAIVAGAGPAGLCAAINLAKGGVSVKVRERAAEVGARFHPNLQGLRYLYMQPERFLSLLGIGSRVDFHYFPKAVICTRKRKLGLDASEGSAMPFVVRGGKGSLEHAMFLEAEKLGVEFEFQSKAGLGDADIIATGSRGAPDQAAIGSVFENQDFPRDTQLVVFDDRYSPRGWYSYILPIGADRVEFVTCASREHMPMLSRLHEKAMRERKEIAECVAGRRKIASFGGSACARIPKTAYVGGKYYVGEAAGFQDPYMGFGIAYALRSGRLAAESMLGGPDYDASWKHQFGYYLRKDAAYGFAMRLLGDALPELVMSRYEDGQKVDLSSMLPERSTAYRLLVESAYAISDLAGKLGAR